MSPIMASSLGVGICCFIFPFIANATGIPVWMAFAGCTSYFVAGGGKTGFIKSMGSNYTGLAWAMAVFFFYGTNIMQTGGTQALFFGALATGIISWGMTYQSRIDLLSFVPSTFIGAFSTFACGGEWKLLALSFLAGNLLGVSCDYLGRYLNQSFVESVETSTAEAEGE